MLIAGALVGLAGANQVLGTVTSGVTVDLDAGIGFDAITVALLGRSRPLGILAAGLLFGAFKAGGFAMQASAGHPGRHRAGRAVADRAVHRGAAAGRAIFRLPDQGGEVSTTRRRGRASRSSETRRCAGGDHGRRAARRPSSSASSPRAPAPHRGARPRVRRHDLPAGHRHRLLRSCRRSRCRRRPRRWVLVVVCALLHGRVASACTRQRRNTPLWLVVVFAVAWMVGFLTWAAAGGTIPVVGLLAGSLALAVPLVFGALGGVLGERAGVVNIAIDGQLLAGAFAAAIVASSTGLALGRAHRRDVRRRARRADARPVRDQLLRRPGDRRRRAQRAGHRPDQLLVQPGAGPQRRGPELAAAVRRDARSRCSATSR